MLISFSGITQFYLKLKGTEKEVKKKDFLPKLWRLSNSKPSSSKEEEKEQLTSRTKETIHNAILNNISKTTNKSKLKEANKSIRQYFNLETSRDLNDYDDEDDFDEKVKKCWVPVTFSPYIQFELLALETFFGIPHCFTSAILYGKEGQINEEEIHQNGIFYFIFILYFILFIFIYYFYF